VRWGTASLAAAAGAQAVLGPALLVGSWRAAASAAFAALALVLLARDRRTAPAFGLAAAAVAAGPMLPHDIGVRLLGVVVGVGAAHVATRLPRASSSAALVAGVVALVLSAAA
jgi:uncharacterized membrane protein YgaE (UPF0421/DUF939 family)